jgi:drug/metabolite transporter (DMT)-like permease
MKKSLEQELEQNHFHSSHHLAKGILLTLLFWLLATFNFVLARSAQESTTVPVILLVQNAIGLLFTFPWAIKHHVKLIRGPSFKLIWVRCLFGQIHSALVFLAVNTISLANTAVFNNVAPILVPFIAYFWLKNKIERKIWPGIILGFLGVLLILKPNPQIFHVGAIFGLLAPFFLASVMISLRLLAHREKSLTVLFFFFLTGFLLSLPLSLIFWKTPSIIAIIQMIVIGLFSVVGQFIFLLAFRYATPTQLGPFSYAAVIYSALFDWLIWNHIPNPFSIVGMLLITAGGVFTILYSRQPRLQKT